MRPLKPRMFSTVGGILAISMLTLASGLLFRVDIVIPQKEGRSEIDDINFINGALYDFRGIKVIFATKAYDGEKVLLVLDGEESCEWFLLTSAMTQLGYRLAVTPLQKCNDYAKSLGVDVPYPPLDLIKEVDVLMYFRVQFYDAGLNTDQYLDRMKDHFEKDRIVMQNGGKFVCFRNMGELPDNLMYLGTATAAELKQDYKGLRNEAKASIKLDFVQSFKAYTNNCNKSKQ